METDIQTHRQRCAAGRMSAHAKDMESNTSSRKRGRPPGNKHQCSKPKAIRGVKARRMEPITGEEQSKQVSNVDGNTHTNNNSYHTNTNNTDNTTMNTNERNNHYPTGTLNDSNE